MKKYNIGVFIGRFQPLHNAHLNSIKLALSEVDRLFIILGSDCQAKTVKNPWTSSERISMIRNCLSQEENLRVFIAPVRDYLYSDNLWIVSIQSEISKMIEEVGQNEKDVNITLFGHNKDSTTYYLKAFPKWSFRETGNLGKDLVGRNINATKVRDMFFSRNSLDLKRVVPEPVFQALQSEIGTPEYERLYDEFKHVVEYKEMWGMAPYPVTFVTTDAVVIKSGHVLIVKRKGYPGKGLLALPGGFVNQGEFIEDSCIRELKEETCLRVNKDKLVDSIIDSKVFDHPDRSLRGRTITHAFCIDLGIGDLPKVQGADDADKAFWLSLREINRREEEFFEDHFHIINYFTNKF